MRFDELTASGCVITVLVVEVEMGGVEGSLLHTALL